jgi:hypothetical protein
MTVRGGGMPQIVAIRAVGEGADFPNHGRFFGNAMILPLPRMRAASFVHKALSRPPICRASSDQARTVADARARPCPSTPVA